MQAASFAAHAYTRVTRRPGVCMGCSGPGATNLLTGVATAFTDCAPLIAIGGEARRPPELDHPVEARADGQHDVGLGEGLAARVQERQRVVLGDEAA